MLKHINILITLCIIALVLGGLATLFYFVCGNFKLAGAGLCGVALFFALLVVLLKEQRIARIMQEDDYDQEREAV